MARFRLTALPILLPATIPTRGTRDGPSAVKTVSPADARRRPERNTRWKSSRRRSGTKRSLRREAFPTFGSPAPDDLASCARAHAGAKTMLPLATTVLRLVRSFHWLPFRPRKPTEHPGVCQSFRSRAVSANDFLDERNPRVRSRPPGRESGGSISASVSGLYCGGAFIAKALIRLVCAFLRAIPEIHIMPRRWTEIFPVAGRRRGRCTPLTRFSTRCG